ncbi:MAG: hypothetical protein BM555_01800 [Crocinitomix sp. MedPE-SWsnd]|nr:MAG: hypothetical protein BM555_01800 [Crocinitomix sp. MedPE-SWsnd]
MIERIHRLIKHETNPPNSVIELLSNTTIGTAGSLYQLLDTKEKIHQLHKPHFLYLERNEKAIGNVTICERPISMNGRTQDSLYIRYFAFDEVYQGGSKKGNGISAFHHYLKTLFNTSNLDPLEPEANKSVYWAFIDPENARSFNMNEQFGFETIGKFRTTAFSRVTPKNSVKVSRIQKNEREGVLAAIKSFNEEYSFFSDVHLFDNGDYYVLKENNEIVAGIQANPVHWKIKSLPGLKGKILMNAAPYIPRIRKLINPKNHKFLATEGLFWKKGFENRVEELLGAVLHQSGHHSLLLWTDTNNTRLSELQINWGFIQKSKKDNLIHIVAKFNGFETSEIDQIKKSKKYLSGFDMT